MFCCLYVESCFVQAIFKALISYSNTRIDKLNGDFFPLRFIELFPSPLLSTMRFNSPRTFVDETLLYIENFSVRTLKIYSSNVFFIFFRFDLSLCVWLFLMHAKIYIHMQIFNIHMCIRLSLRFCSMSCNFSK